MDVALGEGLAAGTGSDGYGGTDTLNSVENVTGSAYDDTLTGNSQDNVLSGEAGDDVIQGLAGDDTLAGGDGTDTASYADSDTGVTVDLSTTDAQDTVGAGSDTITEIETLMGSGHDDTLKGNADGNTIISSGGTDTLEGTEGPDRYMFYQGQWGNETIIEEAKGTSLLDLVDDVIGTDLAGDTDDSASVDILDFSNVSDDLTFLFNADGTVTITDGVNTLSNIANIESIIGGSGTTPLFLPTGPPLTAPLTAVPVNSMFWITPIIPQPWLWSWRQPVIQPWARPPAPTVWPISKKSLAGLPQMKLPGMKMTTSLWAAAATTSSPAVTAATHCTAVRATTPWKVVPEMT